MILAGELQLMKLQRRGLGLAMSSPCCLVKSVAQKKKKTSEKRGVSAARNSEDKANEKYANP